MLKDARAAFERCVSSAMLRWPARGWTDPLSILAFLAAFCPVVGQDTNDDGDGAGCCADRIGDSGQRVLFNVRIRRRDNDDDGEKARRAKKHDEKCDSGDLFRR